MMWLARPVHRIELMKYLVNVFSLCWRSTRYSTTSRPRVNRVLEGVLCRPEMLPWLACASRLVSDSVCVSGDLEMGPEGGCPASA